MKVWENEPNTVGLSERSHAKLHRLKEENYFDELVDAYRFAVAYAVAKGYDLNDSSKSPSDGRRQTIFNVGTLDPNRELYSAVRLLAWRGDEPVFRTIERLAEFGVTELARIMDQGELDVINILESGNITGHRE